jgi:hypothetical protein
MFDPLYAALVAVMIALWVIAVQQDRVSIAAATGAVLTLTTFMTFNVLVIGFFMVAVALVVNRTGAWGIARHAAVVASTCALLYAILWMAAGYNPLATFPSAWRNQHALLAAHSEMRPYPESIWNDLIDFALGSAWISLVLVGSWAANALRGESQGRVVTRIVLLALSQLLVVAVSGLLQAETARIWNFMLPLLAIPIGISLKNGPRHLVMGTLACEILLLVVVFQNMKFL